MGYWFLNLICTNKIQTSGKPIELLFLEKVFCSQSGGKKYIVKKNLKKPNKALRIQTYILPRQNQHKKIILIKNPFLAYNFEKFQGLGFCIDDGTHFHPQNGQYHGIEDDCYHFLIDQNKRLLPLQKLSWSQQTKMNAATLKRKKSNHEAEFLTWC